MKQKICVLVIVDRSLVYLRVTNHEVVTDLGESRCLGLDSLSKKLVKLSENSGRRFPPGGPKNIAMLDP